MKQLLQVVSKLVVGEEVMVAGIKLLLKLLVAAILLIAGVEQRYPMIIRPALQAMLGVQQKLILLWILLMPQQLLGERI